jgi:hypothetical protein
MPNINSTKETSMTQTQPKASPVNETDAYREYHAAVRPAEVPAAAFDDFQLVASTVRLWWLRTKWPLDAVLQDSFYANVADLRLRAEDRIEVVAGDRNSGPAEHALIVVNHVDKSGGDVRVSLLARYERAK